MVRHAKALALVIACILIGCAAQIIERDYVPTLFLDPREQRAIGKMECDLFNHPVVYVHPAITKERRAWVIVHEKIHVSQTREHGGCDAFQQRMADDSSFRLAREAEAYCGSLQAQQYVRAEINPTYADIVEILREKYYAAYDSAAVVKALIPCTG